MNAKRRRELAKNGTIKINPCDFVETKVCVYIEKDILALDFKAVPTVKVINFTDKNGKSFSSLEGDELKQLHELVLMNLFYTHTETIVQAFLKQITDKFSVSDYNKFVLPIWCRCFCQFHDDLKFKHVKVQASDKASMMFENKVFSEIEKVVNNMVSNLKKCFEPDDSIAEDILHCIKITERSVYSIFKDIEYIKVDVTHLMFDNKYSRIHLYMSRPNGKKRGKYSLNVSEKRDVEFPSYMSLEYVYTLEQGHNNYLNSEERYYINDSLYCTCLINPYGNASLKEYYYYYENDHSLYDDEDKWVQVSFSDAYAPIDALLEDPNKFNRWLELKDSGKGRGNVGCYGGGYSYLEDIFSSSNYTFTIQYEVIKCGKCTIISGAHIATVDNDVAIKMDVYPTYCVIATSDGRCYTLQYNGYYDLYRKINGLEYDRFNV